MTPTIAEGELVKLLQSLQACLAVMVTMSCHEFVPLALPRDTWISKVKPFFSRNFLAEVSVHNKSQPSFKPSAPVLLGISATQYAAVNEKRSGDSDQAMFLKRDSSRTAARSISCSSIPKVLSQISEAAHVRLHVYNHPPQRPSQRRVIAAGHQGAPLGHEASSGPSGQIDPEMR